MQSQGWTRISHGTGMGHSSTAGFWIPKQLLQAPPLHRTQPPSKKRKAGVASRASAGRGRGSGRRQTTRPTPEAGQQAGEDQTAGGHLEEVQVQIPATLPVFQACRLHKVESLATESQAHRQTSMQQ